MHVLTLLSGAIALLPVVPPAVVVVAPVLQLLVQGRVVAMILLLLLHGFVFLEIDGVLHNQAEDPNGDSSATGAPPPPAFCRRARRRTALDDRGWRAPVRTPGRSGRCTGWLAVTSAVAGIYVFRIPGIIIGPLTVACLQSLGEIGAYALQQERAAVVGAVGPTAHAGVVVQRA